MKILKIMNGSVSESSDKLTNDRAAKNVSAKMMIKSYFAGLPTKTRLVLYFPIDLDTINYRSNLN